MGPDPGGGDDVICWYRLGRGTVEWEDGGGGGKGEDGVKERGLRRGRGRKI
jgi:hypothetical protein